MRSVAAIAMIVAALASPSVPRATRDDVQSQELHAASVGVLIVQRGYDGAVESAGGVIAWQYTGSSMYLEWADTTSDGMFRNGFEGAE